MTGTTPSSDADESVETTAQYDAIVTDGKFWNRLWCRIRGHFWGYQTITLFGTSDVDSVQCHRCGQLRVEGDRDV